MKRLTFFTLASCFVTYAAFGYSPKPSEKESSLLAALGAGNLSAISARDAMKLHENPNLSRKIMIFCLENCELTVLNWLIDKGANINDRALVKEIAHVAGNPHRHQTLKQLRSRGFNVDMKGDDGKTALMIAAERNDFEAVRMLLDLGADPAITIGLWFMSKQAADFARDDRVIRLLREACV